MIKVSRLDVFRAACVASMIGVGFIDPRLVVIPLVILVGFIAWKSFFAIRNLSIAQRKFFLFYGPISTVFVDVYAQKANAVTISFLLSATESMFKTCIVGQVTGFGVLTGLFFGLIRLVVMIAIALQCLEGYNKNKQNQDNSEQVKTVVTAIIAILVVGLIEPSVSRDCT